MRTVKEVAELTGISVRTLQYYDEIGLFRPTQVTQAGYRLYDDDSLHTLQQILFFKELDFPLKDIKRIMENPHFNQTEAFKKQKILLQVKRDRLNRLLRLLDKLEKGEPYMSFKEFDLSEYFSILEQFKQHNTEEIMKHWGSVEAFDEMLQQMKEHEASIAQTAIQYYGSVENYTAAMQENISNFSENMEKMQQIKAKGYVEKNKRLMKQLVADVSKDVTSKEIQDIVDEWMNLLDPDDCPGMDQRGNYWNTLIDGYLHNPAIIEIIEKQYGVGTSQFIGEALQYYMNKQSNNK